MIKSPSESTNLDNLPDEMKIKVFSYLDAKSLCAVKKTCKEEQRLSEEHSLWLNRISENFPYLLETKAKLCEENPEKAYREEYISYQNMCEADQLTCNMDVVLSALKGNLKKIDSASNNPTTVTISKDSKVQVIPTPNYLSDDTKKQLYVWAAANGHQEALNKLNIHEIAKAFDSAVIKGQLASVQHLTPIFTPENLNGQFSLFVKKRYLEKKEWGIETAAKYGNLATVKYFNQIMPDLNPAKGYALIAAAAHGQLEVVRYLVETSNIDQAAKDAAFLSVVKNHLEIIKYLLPMVSEKSKKLGLLTAAQMGYLGIVQYLLTASETCVQNVKIAFKKAVENSQTETVKYLVLHKNVDYQCKKWAIRHANSEMTSVIRSSISFKTMFQEEHKDFYQTLKQSSIKSKQKLTQLTSHIKYFLLPNILNSLKPIVRIPSLIRKYATRQFSEYVASNAVQSIYSSRKLSTLTLEQLKAVKTGMKSAYSWKEWCGNILDINATKHYTYYRAGMLLKSKKLHRDCEKVNRMIKEKKNFSA